MTPTTRTRYHAGPLLALTLAVALLVAVVLAVTGDPAGATPTAPEPPEVTTLDWADGDNTASAWDICLWTGARDIGTTGVILRRARNIDWYGDAWVACDFELQRRVGSFLDRSCQPSIVDRDRAHLLSGAYYRGPAQTGAAATRDPSCTPTLTRVRVHA
jgi:hypothetical protein